MSKVKFISSPTEIPTRQTFVLVKYGEESGQTKNSLDLTIMVARNQSLANIHTAKEIAKRESISSSFCLEIARQYALFSADAFRRFGKHILMPGKSRRIGSARVEKEAEGLEPHWRWPDRSLSLINYRVFWLTTSLDCFSQPPSGNRGYAYASIGLRL
jgi:hypothetical protein